MTAAYYPEHPTDEQQRAMRGFVGGIAEFYPCSHCRAAFADDIKRHPIKASSRRDLSIWLCKRHNQVNMELGKSKFPCTMAALDERWRDGHKDCWQ